MTSYTRAFPGQTDIFFWIIVIVLWGVLLAGAIGPSPILMWPVTLSMFILPMRALLAWPDKEIKKQQDQDATYELTQNGILPHLQMTLDHLAKQAGYPEPIKLIISQTPKAMRSIGSWRRHFLLLGQDVAQMLYSDLQDPQNQARAQAALLHEVAHFLHKDVQRVGYTRELLKGSFVIVVWWMVFLLGWLGLALVAGQSLLDFDLAQVTQLDPVTRQLLEPLFTLSPADRTDIAHKIEIVSTSLLLNYIINAFWNIVLMGFILWLFFWRRMLRMQEHQADYFVNEVMQKPVALREALIIYNPQSLVVRDHKQGITTQLIERWHDFTFGLSERIFYFSENRWYQRLINVFERIKRWFSFHPTFDERVTFLLNPDSINNNWFNIALPTLALVLALEILLVTPLSSYHVSTYVIHFATLAVFAVLSTWALPHIVHGQFVRKSLVKILLLVYLGRLIWIGFNFALIIFLAIVAPSIALEILNSIAFAGSRFAGIPTFLPVDNPLILTLSIIPSYLGLQILSLAIVIAFLFIYYRLQHQALTNPAPVNWRQRHWLLVITLSVVAVTLLLTPLSDVLQGYFDLLFQPTRLLTYGVGIIVSLCIIWWARIRS